MSKCENCGAETHWAANANGFRAKAKLCAGCWRAYEREQRKKYDNRFRRIPHYAGRTPFDSRPNHPHQDELTQDQLTALLEGRDPYNEANY